MRLPLETPLIQVAGIRDAAEAALVQECGIRYLGFPLRLPINRVRAVLITYLDGAEAIGGFCRSLGARMVQLHGDISAAELARLRELDPGLTIIKSLVVGLHSMSALQGLVIELGPLVDGFLTDTYAPETGAAGATGRTHDWEVSRRLVELSARPVILAGGLTPANVGEAISVVRPAGVDVHTGVEDAPGRKDRAKLLAFVAEASAAFGGY
jgi:phosphoribosylanthranilate isomerase